MENQPTVEQGVGAGIGITVDEESDVVVVIIIQALDGTAHAVSMIPEIAKTFGRAMRDMSREAEALQFELADLDPEEVHERLNDIRMRHATRTSGPQPPV